MTKRLAPPFGPAGRRPTKAVKKPAENPWAQRILDEARMGMWQGGGL